MGLQIKTGFRVWRRGGGRVLLLCSRGCYSSCFSSSFIQSPGLAGRGSGGLRESDFFSLRLPDGKLGFPSLLNANDQFPPVSAPWLPLYQRPQICLGSYKDGPGTPAVRAAQSDCVTGPEPVLGMGVQVAAGVGDQALPVARAACPPPSSLPVVAAGATRRTTSGTRGRAVNPSSPTSR